MTDRVLEPDADATAVAQTPGVEISNAISRLHKHYVGRGPTSARTTLDENLVVCLLEGGYTRAEQTLEANDRADVVAAGRLGLQDVMRAEMVAAVQEVVGRPVLSFMSANDLRRHLQVEVFVLGDGAPGLTAPADG